MSILEVKNLKKFMELKEKLKPKCYNVNFSVEEGEFIAIWVSREAENNAFEYCCNFG